LPSRCGNVGIQYNLVKHLILGQSDVSGWGIFAGEPIPKGEYIAEYRGELISEEEANRRGIQYDNIRSTSYLFTLSNEHVVDAYRRGNKIKFANHCDSPNCVAKVMRAAGDLRIGIYALQNIQLGEELFLDYNYSVEFRKFVSLKANNIPNGNSKSMKQSGQINKATKHASTNKETKSSKSKKKRKQNTPPVSKKKKHNPSAS